MIDIKTCLKKLGYVGVLDFATVDEDGAPQVRNISAIHYEGTTPECNYSSILCSISLEAFKTGLSVLQHSRIFAHNYPVIIC